MAASATDGGGVKPLPLLSIGATPSPLVRSGLQVSSLLIPLLLWTVISALELVDGKFLPSPAAVLESLASMAREGILFQDIVASTGRVFAGFFLATLVGCPWASAWASIPRSAPCVSP